MLDKELSKLRIIVKVKRLTKYVASLKSRNFASNSPRLYAEDLEKLLAIISENISKLSPSTYQNFENYLDEGILEYCSFIERSTPSYIPWSFVSELEDICRTNIEKDIGVVLKSDLQYNYSVHNINLIDFIIEQLSEYFGKLPEFDIKGFSNTRIFTIPLLEKSNAILHSVLFHEIGHHHHAIFDTLIGVERYNKVLNEVFNNRKPEEFLDDDLFTYAKSFEILKGAVREIYSDIYAYEFCGLSIIFALRFFQQKYPVLVLPDVHTNFYPPMKYRIRTLFEIFENDKDSETIKSGDDTNPYHYAIKKELNNIASFLSEKDDLLELNTKLEISLAYKALDKLIPEIVSDATLRVNPKFTYSDSHPKLFNKFQEEIPPCEIDDKPQSLVDILLSGWAAYFHILYDNSLSLDLKITKINFINTLILKSITQTSLLKKFQESKDAHSR